ncbi:Ig-like domain-containing protein [Dielma fastidiosa]|uniref:Ig-like domain-containing protein n=1 Tax=Dielma fastidiosa TaxID=1034346 RepID=UPI003561AA69
MMKEIRKILKVMIALSMAVGISAYVPESEIEVKATEAASQIKDERWTGTISGIEPRNDGDTYHIYTGEELAWIAQQVNQGYSFADKKIVLERDIDLDNIAWTPIGIDLEHAFAGTFDGQGRTIKNLYVKQADEIFSGFFGVTKNADLKNIIFIDAVIAANNNTSNYGGTLSAQLIHTIVSNIVIENADLSGERVGGLAGRLSNGSWVIDSFVKNSVIKGRTVGGILGLIQPVTSSEFGNHSSSGLINSVSKDNYIKIDFMNPVSLAGGGLIGYVGTEDQNINESVYHYICNNYSDSKIEVMTSVISELKNIACGGLIGEIGSRIKNVNLYSNYTTSTIINQKGGASGAVIGQVAYEISVDNVYWLKDASKWNVIDSEMADIGNLVNVSSFSGFTSKQDNQMQGESFAALLNAGNLDASILPTDDNGNAYTYLNWEASPTSKYPIFKEPEVQSIQVYPSNQGSANIISVSLTDEIQLHAAAFPFSAFRNLSFTWEFDNSHQADIDAGKISVSNTCLIKTNDAEAGDYLLHIGYGINTMTYTLKVLDNGYPISASINNPGILELGNTKKLTANVYPSDADSSNLIWKIKGKELNGEQLYVEENEIAKINSKSGLLTPKAQGKVTISLWADDMMLDEINLLIQSSTWDGVTSLQPKVEGNTYHITSGAELRWIAEQCNNGNTFAGKTIVLDNSIDLGGKNATPAEWTAIGSGGSSYFSGIFDGQGFTISNIYAASDKNQEFKSLFGWIVSGTIKNLKVEHFIGGSAENINSEQKIGGLAGYVRSESLLENIIVSNGTIYSKMYAGGLVSLIYGSEVRNCHVENVNVDGKIAGGLIGYIDGGSITNSSASGQAVNSIVPVAETEKMSIGGLIGETSSNTIISNSYANIDVQAIKINEQSLPVYTGGLIGSILRTNTAIDTITLNNVYANGTIKNQYSIGEGYLPGAIAGYINVEGLNFDLINNVYWNKNADHYNSSSLITSGIKAFGVGDSSNTATNKTTSVNAETLVQAEGGLADTLNANAEGKSGWFAWTSNGNTAPRLTNTTPITVSIKQEDLYLRRNESVELEAVMKPYNPTKTLDVKWSLNADADTDSFELSGNKLTIKETAVTYSMGTITMTAVDETGKQYTDMITVTVMPEETEITALSIKNPGTISTGDSVQMEAVIEPANAVKDQVIWSIKKGYEKYASITTDGKLTAMKAGTLIIEASIGGKHAECTITIQQGSKWDGETIEEPEIKGKYIYISKASELAWIATELGKGKADSAYHGFENYVIVLLNSIDVNNKNWTGLYYDSWQNNIIDIGFYGIFDGQSYSISNLDSTMFGLFPSIEEGSLVKNLVLDHCNAFVSGYTVGRIDSVIYKNGIDMSAGCAITGDIRKGGIISNCAVLNSTFIGATNSGLIAICNAGGSIINCYVDGCTLKLNSKADSIGGLIGFNTSGDNFEVGMINCLNRSKIIIDYTGDLIGVGGLTGATVAQNTQSFKFENNVSITDLDVKKNSGSVGSLFGSMAFDGTFKNNYFYQDSLFKINSTLATAIAVGTVRTESRPDDTMVKSFSKDDAISIVKSLNEYVISNPTYNGVELKHWKLGTDGLPTLGVTEIENITVTPSALVLRPGETAQLDKVITPFGAPDMAVTWTSSNPAYATVDSNGFISVSKTAPAGKTIKITMTPNDASYPESTCTITIVPAYDAIESIILSGKNEVYTNETVKLTASVYPDTADETAINWQITSKPDGSNATVSSKGTLNAGSMSGELIIEASSKANSAIKGSITITVKKPISSTVWDGTASEPVLMNTANKTIHIQTPNELAWISEKTNAGEYNGFEGYTLYLDNDIDMGGNEASKPVWEPIGTSSYEFKGNFNGLGHSIKNFYTDNTNEGIGGLFGCIGSRSISNLTIDNINIEGKAGSLLASAVSDNISIVNVHTAGSVQNFNVDFDNIHDHNNVVSGMIGVVSFDVFDINKKKIKVYVEGCSVDLSINNVTNATYNGGIIAQIYDHELTVINNEINMDVNNYTIAIGTRENHSETGQHIGGVIGEAGGGPFIIENNLVKLSVDVKGEYQYTTRIGSLIGTTWRDALHDFNNNYLKIEIDSNIDDVHIYRLCKVIGTYDKNKGGQTIFNGYFDTSSYLNDKFNTWFSVSDGNLTDGIQALETGLIEVTPSQVSAPASDSDSLVNKLNQWVNKENLSSPNTYRTWTVVEGVPTFGETTTVSLDKHELFVKINESALLTATVLPENANNTLKWSSSKPTVAYVDDKGQITGLIPGTALITATTVDGNSDTCLVTVGTVPTKITITAENDRRTLINHYIPIEDQEDQSQLNLSASVKPIDALSLTWTSSDETIASIQADLNDFTKAIVTAHDSGTVIIRAESENGVIGAIELNVKNAVHQITFDQELKSDAAHPLELTYTVNEDADDKAVSFEVIQEPTENTSSITSEKGTVLFEGSSVGAYTIKASSADGNFTETYTIMISEAVLDSLKIQPDEGSSVITLERGESVQLRSVVLPEVKNRGSDVTMETYAGVSYELVEADSHPGFTLNGTVLSADESVKDGEKVLISAKSKLKDKNGNELSDTIEVVIGRTELKSLTIKNKEAGEELPGEVGVNQTLNLIAEATPKTASDQAVKWSVDDPTIAAIKENGEISFLSEGTVTVKAESLDGTVSTTHTFTVKAIYPTSLIIKQGETVGFYKTETLQLTVDYLPINTTQKKLTYEKINDPDGIIESISDQGLISFNLSEEGNNKPGTAVVKVSGEKEGDNQASAQITIICSDVKKYVTKITGIKLLNDMPLRVGGQLQCNAVFEPADANQIDFKWEAIHAENETISDIVEMNSGTLKANRPGTFRIRVSVEGEGNTSVSYTSDVITVEEAKIESIGFNVSSITLSAGGTSGVVKAIVQPKDYVNQNVEWTSSYAGITIVDQDGNEIKEATNQEVYLKASEDAMPGMSAMIQAKAEGSTITASFPVMILRTAGSRLEITYDEARTLIAGGESLELNAKIYASDGKTPASSQEVLWESGDPSIAKIDKAGTVKPLKAGAVTITARAKEDEKIMKQITLTVKEPALDSLTLSQASMVLLSGSEDKELRLLLPEGSSADDFEWTSSDSSVLEIIDMSTTRSIKIKALKAGTATITVQQQGNTDESKKATCEVKVVKDPILVQTIELQGPDKAVELNEIVIIKAVINKDTDMASNETLTWTSKDESIVRVLDQTGTFTRVQVIRAQGNVTIEAAANDGSGVKASIEIRTAGNTPTGITLDKRLIQMSTSSPGESLKAMIAPSTVQNQQVIWSVSQPGIIQPINSTKPSITLYPMPGVQPNSFVEVTATTTNGISTSCIVAITEKKVESLLIQRSKLQVSAGETIELPIKIEPSDASQRELRWNITGSDPEAVSIHDNQLTAKSEGTVFLQAFSTDGSNVASNQIEIEVIAAQPAPTLEKISMNKTTLNLLPGDSGSLKVISEPLNYDLKDELIRWNVEVLGSVNSAQQALILEQFTLAPRYTIDETGNHDETETGIIDAEFDISPTMAEVIDSLSSEESPISEITLKVTASIGSDESAMNAETTIKIKKEEGAEASITSVNIKGTDGVSITSPIELMLGEQLRLLAEIITEPTDAVNVYGIWSSDDEQIAAIDTETGILKAVNSGSAVISYQPYIGAKPAGEPVTLLVIVKKDTSKLEYIQLSETSLSLSVNRTHALTYDIEPMDYSGPRSIQWTSSDGSIATVDESGNISTHSEGTAMITLDLDGYLAFCKVTVSTQFETPVSEITTALSDDFAELELGPVEPTIFLEAKADALATDTSLIYQSSDESIASVDENGMVTGHEAGFVIITIRPVSDKNPYYKQVFIKVIPQICYQVLLDQTDLSMKKGDSVDLQAVLTPQVKEETSLTYQWETESSEITITNADQPQATLTLTESAEIGVEYTVTVTAVVEGHEPASAQVKLRTVENAALSDFKVVDSNFVVYTQDSTNNISMNSGESIGFTFTADPADKQAANVHNSDPSAAEISKAGDQVTLTAKKAGTVHLTFTSIYDSSMSVVITVNITESQDSSIYPTSISLSSQNGKNVVEIGETLQLKAEIKPEGAESGLYYSTSNKNIAAVSENGMVSGISEGEAVLTAYSQKDMDVRGSITISVAKPEAKPAKFTKLQIKDGNGKVYDYDEAIYAQSQDYVFRVENTVSRKAIEVIYELNQPQAIVKLGNEAQVSGNQIDFTSGSVMYELTAQDGTVTHEQVSVLLSDAPSEDAVMVIEKATINGTDYQAETIDDKTYRVTIPYVLYQSGAAMNVTYTTENTSNVYIGAELQSSGISTVKAERAIHYTLIGQNGKKQDVVLQIESGPYAKTMSLSQGGKQIEGTIEGEVVSFTVDENFKLNESLSLSFTTDSYTTDTEDRTVMLTSVTTFGDTKELKYTGKVELSNGKETVTYTLQVTQIVQLPKTQLTEFKLMDKEGNEILGQNVSIEGDLILVKVPNSTDLTAMTMSGNEEITLSVEGQSGAIYDLTKKAVIIASQAEHAQSRYTLIITKETGGAEITSMTLNGATKTAEGNWFNFVFEKGVDITSLIPVFTKSQEAAVISINGIEYEAGTAVDFRHQVTIVIELNGIEKTYYASAAVKTGPQFTGKITISQEIMGESDSETITLTATPDNENGTVVFEAEADKFDLTKPFTITYTTNDGSVLYENTIEITSGSTISLGTTEKSFILKNGADESVYTMKIIEKAGSSIDIKKFDLINVPKVGTIYGRIDHDRKQIYLDVLVDYTEDFTSMTLDIEADADMILVNGKLINGPITLDLSNPVNVTFMKNGEVITYEVITSSVIDGPYISRFEIVNTDEGTLSSLIDNKNRKISVIVPNSISGTKLRKLMVDYDTSSQDKSNSIIVTINEKELSNGDTIDLRNPIELVLSQNDKQTVYTIDMKRPAIEGDLNGDGVVNAIDVAILLELI